MIDYRDDKDLPKDDLLTLYRAADWSSAEKPDQLHRGMRNSHSLVTAWDGDRLVGLANAISDGHLVVYYPHVVVHPDYRGRGVGRGMMARLMRKYEGFHQHSILADPRSVGFFQRCSFQQSPCAAMWIYDADDHTP